MLELKNANGVVLRAEGGPVLAGRRSLRRRVQGYLRIPILTGIDYAQMVSRNAENTEGFSPASRWRAF